MRIFTQLLIGLLFSVFAFGQSTTPFDQKHKKQELPTEVNQSNTTKVLHNPYQSRAYQTLPPLQKNQIGLSKEESILQQSLDIDYAPITGMPIFINGFQYANKNALKSPAQKEKAAMDFLEAVQEKICVENAKAEFVVLKSEANEGQQHIKLQQMYQEIPVYGAELIVHVKDDGAMSLNGRNQPTPYIDNTEPSLLPEEAIGITHADLAQHSHFVEMSEEAKQMLQYEQPNVELVIYPSKTDFGAFNLAYHLTARPNFMERYEYFVDAHTGEILNHYNHTCSLVVADGPATASAVDINGIQRTVNTYLYQNNYYLYDASKDMYNGPIGGLPKPGDGGIETLDFQNQPYTSGSFADIPTPDNNWTSNNERIGITAHYNSGQCYEYFKNTHNRTSINGQGGDIISFVNVADDNGGGLDNAFWNGQYMFYGSGNQAFDKSLAAALDVAGHEMSHGVIQNTANLEYQGESGAINESMADMFGAMIDRDDWKLGEDVVNPQFFPSGALRDMQNPHNGASSGNFQGGWQPAHYDERYTGSQDNGGVHINSGIPNRAYYKVATDIGKSKAEKIYYYALSNYLTRSSRFIDLRLSIIQAAENINSINVTTADVNAIKNAFASVGIGDGAPTQTQEDIEENNGAEYIISLDVNPEDNTSLYASTVQPTTGEDYSALTTTNINRKPSITDDGKDLYFIGADDKKVHHIRLSTSSNPPTVISEDVLNISSGSVNEWDNVAVSKDGKRLALISIFIDNSVYIYDLDGNQGINQLELYNPTFSEGIETNTVQYADALEWDYTSEYIMYDAYNIIEGSGGQEDYDFWDLGLIRAWNQGSGTHSDGAITQVFSNLPEGVSIGNPTFSKNSPYIFAFDYWDTTEDQINLLGANFETSEIGTIVENNGVLAYASYSIDDNQIIYASKAENDSWIKRINLSNDKISASGNPSNLIPVAEWPLWFAQGTRALPVGVEEVELVSEQFSIAPNPFVDNFDVYFNTTEEATLQIYDVTGKLMQSLEIAPHQAKQHIAAQSWAMGTYIAKLTAKDWTLSQKLVKLK